MRILGIETSCDETAAAVVERGRSVLSSVVASQETIHQDFGGIVPELASRRHLAAILPVIQSALTRANLGLSDIDGIAVTKGPGLIGSLLVGLSLAKALAWARKIPFVGVHHIEGHLAATLLTESEPGFPLVGLVVSGGHTNLYRMNGPHRYELLGQTRDDAAGEAFDKVANLCGLGFPGGPAIDRMARQGNPRTIRFPRAVPDSLDFSFSGLKTAVVRWVQRNGLPREGALADLVASFQEAVVDSLVSKLLTAAERNRVTGVVVCGGVARNSRLRERLEAEAPRAGLRLWLAPADLCTDNAAMIAAAGYSRLARGERDGPDLNAQATIPLTTE